MSVISWFRNIWEQYKENQKRRELYARLDRNREGRFSNKKFMKTIGKAVKEQKKKDGK